MDTVSASDLIALVGAWRATFAEERDFLISLDGKVGDSDLGITMAKAFAAADEAVSAAPAGAPIGKLLIMAGMAMAKAAPSTMGTLTATGFMRGGKALEGASTLGVRDIAMFWRAYGNGIAERGKVKLGDKTVLDVIDPIARAFEEAATANATLTAALSAATGAAEAALEATKTMVAQQGKAAAFQEKSAGLQDAGATVGVLMIRTMFSFASTRSGTAGPQAATAATGEGSGRPLSGSDDVSAIARHPTLRGLFEPPVAVVQPRPTAQVTPVSTPTLQAIRRSGSNHSRHQETSMTFLINGQSGRTKVSKFLFGTASRLRTITRTALVAGSICAASIVGTSVAMAADDSVLQAARSMTPPDYAGPTTPAKAPKDIKVAVVTCLSVLHGCVSPADGIQHAGEKLGWTVKVYDGGGTPNKQNAAILDAISSGANVIATIAIDPNLIQLALSEAKKAGVLVVAGSNGIDTPNPVKAPGNDALGFAFDVSPDYGTLGVHAAQWMAADSNGKANIALFSDKEFPSIMAQEAGVLQGLAECKTCTVSKQIYFTATQIASQLGQMTVDYARSHPDVDYIYGAFDPPVAVQVAALMQAGMAGKVKIVGALGNQQNLNFIRGGHLQVADMAYDNEYMGWAIVDQTIRLLNKQPLIEPHGENLPFVILDKTNLPAAGADWQAKTGYQDKFLALWK